MTRPDSTAYAITVLGHDRPGIIAETTERLADLGLNLEDSTMTLLRGHFAMMLICAGGVGGPQIEQALAPLAADGTLSVTVRAVPEEQAAPVAGSGWVLTVHGGDRPGIVSAVVAEVARVGGNITDLTTRLAGDLYLLIAEIDLPASADAAAVEQAIGAAAAAVGGGAAPGPAGARARRRRRRDPAPGGDRRTVSETSSGLHPVVQAWTEADLGVAGRVRDVVRAPDPVLSTPGADVDPTAPDVVQLAADLVATMRVSPGCVGLAANQVGVGVRVFCVDVSEHPKTRDNHGTFVLCNAEVVESSRNEKAREGCMSVPDLTGDVKRASRLVVRGQMPGTGEQVELAATAFEARALQHEIDHTDGLLFLDRVAGAHAVYQRQTYL
ncbi:peptide deformylase [Nocardioides sp. R-C-SC26]|uniref:peptide deformylase n=1 Tax=Nocardioides sp. R-C-SC26 TaxID=2870414 RepID=UPI001E614346|nr:peptide deformylase [Nocardioides sp. R-C-SC26]